MAKKPGFVDIAGISFFIYSIYFGAGNLIFPIRIGYRVGDHLTPAMIGFVVAAVILPAMVVWACTRVDGGVEKVTAPLPRWFAVLIGILMYLIIGPLLGLPRFSGVAYTTLQPLLPDDNGGKTLPMIFSVIFFGATLALSINPARILQIVGKIMAPALVVVLLAIAIGAILFPQGPVALPDESLGATNTMDYFLFGFEEGYQALNALGSLVLGIVIISAVHGLGLDKKGVAHYTMVGMLGAGIGLTVTYGALAYLGATAHDLVGVPQSAVTGAEIAPPYANALYGIWGTIALAIVILLACFTTAIGIITACGEYFSKLFPSIGYKTWATVFTALSILIANIGLGPLLIAAKPLLLGIYPIAMCIVFLSLLKNTMKNQRFVFVFTLIPVVPLGILEGAITAKIAAVEPIVNAINWLPLFDEGFGWLFPALVFYIIGMLICPIGDQTLIASNSGNPEPEIG
ncbi:MAG: branched-chain amino acid transport system II carrier protein [Halioglobus sp.]